MRKLSAILRIGMVCVFLAYAAGTVHAQENRIRLSKQGISVGEALKEIETQSGLKIAANLGLLDLSQTVDFKKSEGSITEMLSQILPTEYTYQVTDKNIIIIPPRPQQKAETAQQTVPVIKEETVTNSFIVKETQDPSGSLQLKYIVSEETGDSYVAPQYMRNGKIGRQFAISNPPSAIALKTNLLYGATLTPNLALEIGLGRKTTFELGAGYNFYEPDNGKRWKHWLVQPEFRYWFCERFNGTFVGIHALGGQYSFANIDFPFNIFKDLKTHRYEGEFYGAGIVLGHQWILSKRWSLEAVIGAGYVRVHYDKYPCTSCGGPMGAGWKNYFGPTKAAISFLFFL